MTPAPDPTPDPAPDPTDDDLRRILARTRVVAMVGASDDPLRPSHFVARYLTRRGIRVIPVNPSLAGRDLFGEPAFARLADIPRDIPVDMLDLFRKPGAVPALVAEAIAALPHLRTVWMQLGVTSAEGAALARAQGLDVVQNRCPKIEYQRLHGELRMGGFATGIISARR